MKTIFKWNLKTIFFKAADVYVKCMMPVSYQLKSTIIVCIVVILQRPSLVTHGNAVMSYLEKKKQCAQNIMETTMLCAF